MDLAFTDSEIAVIHELVTLRYQKDVEIQLADCEILLTPDATVPTTHPTVFWFEQEANFVVSKTAESTYRAQFFYTPHEQYSTEINEYHNLEECVSAVLQTQSDHPRQNHKSTTISGNKET